MGVVERVAARVVVMVVETVVAGAVGGMVAATAAASCGKTCQFFLRSSLKPRRCHPAARQMAPGRLAAAGRAAADGQVDPRWPAAERTLARGCRAGRSRSPACCRCCSKRSDGEDGAARAARHLAQWSVPKYGLRDTRRVATWSQRGLTDFGAACSCGDLSSLPREPGSRER